MSLKEFFKSGGLVDRVVGIVDKAVPDKTKSAELKMELIHVISKSQSKVAPWVRAIIAIMFMVVWVFYPEKFQNREDSTRYVLYAIMGFYFLADFVIDRWKRGKN